METFKKDTLKTSENTPSGGAYPDIPKEGESSVPHQILLRPKSWLKHAVISTVNDKNFMAKSCLSFFFLNINLV